MVVNVVVVAVVVVLIVVVEVVVGGEGSSRFEDLSFGTRPSK